jgi:hypothetical protein
MFCEAPENLIAKFSACNAGRVAKKKRRKAEIIFADFLIVSSKFMICDFFVTRFCEIRQSIFLL